ncbi:MAG TPA: hypothetical protein PKW90_20300, partial [Myxococcota bacterium]|nr:hypothetical protein [Myxococcota bacterium]
TYEWTEVQSRSSHRWTDPDGGWEQVDYDRLGRPLQRQRSDAPPEQWQYEDATDRRYHEQPGRATRTTLGDGLGGAHGEERSDGRQRRRWWQQRDAAGRAYRLHAPGRAAMEVDWDSLDRVWQEKSPDGSYLHRQWDDRMAQHTVGGFSFWADREVLSNRDGICRETFKDPLDRVVAVREWEGLEELVWIWHYDGAGRVVEELEPGGLSHRYNYDGLGRLIEHVCGGATEYWTYDEAGNVASHTDMDGYTTGLEYDDSLQVRAIIAPDGGRTELTGAATAVEERSPSGRRVSRRVEERGVVVEDDDGFVERLEGVAEGASWIHRYERRGETTEESRYNGFGELLSVNGPQGRVEMERDDAGRVVHLRSEEGEFSFSYHPITGLLQQVDGPEGSTTIRCNGNEVEECAGTITQTTRLDPKGRPFEVQEGEALRRYRYGAWGGAEVDADGVEQSWSMDPHSQTMVFRDTAGEQ